MPAKKERRGKEKERRVPCFRDKEEKKNAFPLQRGKTNWRSASWTNRKGEKKNGTVLRKFFHRGKKGGGGWEGEEGEFFLSVNLLVLEGRPAKVKKKRRR